MWPNITSMSARQTSVYYTGTKKTLLHVLFLVTFSEKITCLGVSAFSHSHINMSSKVLHKFKVQCDCTRFPKAELK